MKPLYYDSVTGHLFTQPGKRCWKCYLRMRMVKFKNFARFICKCGAEESVNTQSEERQQEAEERKMLEQLARDKNARFKEE